MYETTSTVSPFGPRSFTSPRCVALTSAASSQTSAYGGQSFRSAFVVAGRPACPLHIAGRLVRGPRHVDGEGPGGEASWTRRDPPTDRPPAESDPRTIEVPNWTPSRN